MPRSAIARVAERSLIVGIGIDVVEIDRVAELLAGRDDAAGGRVFSERELADAGAGRGRDASLAARFAAKEAAMKALRTGWARGVGFRDVEIARDEGGAPRLELHGEAARIARSLGTDRIHVSLTHSRTVACAVVILESA